MLSDSQNAQGVARGDLASPAFSSLRWPLFAFALLPMASARAAGPAITLPTGGQVREGQAQIGAPTASSLTIEQSSKRAIIDWSAFSVGQGGAVQFNNGTGATLNRVTGASVSSIDGLLSASGSVYLMNPNGVIIGKTGVVNVGGTFVGSTLDLANSAFMAGGPLTLSGSSSAAVVNYGKIGALGGDVALVAAKVTNLGDITAANGTVGLVSGYRVLLRDQALNDGKFAVLLGGADTAAANGGTISAADAELRANGGNVYGLAGNTAGVIKATGVAQSDGRILLIADGGTTTVAGTLSAAGVGGTPGFIETSGAKVVIGAADITANGGAWLIDPTDITIDTTAAATISSALATSDVTQATAGPGGDAGDITLNSDATISWTSAYALTLTADHDVNLLGAVNVGGSGTFNINTGNGGTLNFGASGRTTFADSVGGHLNINGTSYVLASSFADLAAAIASDSSGHFALADNLAGGASSTAPFGTQSFTGTLEGLGNGIDGASIVATDQSSVGFFQEIGGGGLVENLKLTNLSVSAGGDGLVQVGGLAATNSGLIRNVAASGNVTREASSTAVGGATGGLVARNLGTIDNASFSGAVSGGDYVGGLVGKNFAVVSNSTVSGSVQGGAFVGGLVGRNGAAQVGGGSNFTAQALIQDSSASAAVTGLGESVGGLVGSNSGSAQADGVPDSTISGSSASGAVSVTNGSGDGTGGLAGKNYGIVTGSSASGEVSGTNYVGGLVGKNFNSISGGQASGNVNGASFVGGAVGSSGKTPGGAHQSAIGTISNLSALGNVTATGQYSGGLVGYNATGSSIQSAGAYGTVTGVDDVGGLVGYNDGQIGQNSIILTRSIVSLIAPGKDIESSGSVTATGLGAGGLVGTNGANGNLLYAHSESTVNGNDTAGGAVGRNFGLIDNVDATGSVTATNYAGGLVGKNFSTIVDSQASGSVSGGSYVGGLVGRNGAALSGTGANTTAQASISGSFATGNVTGTGESTGGLVGSNSGSAQGGGAPDSSITDSYATGSVTGNDSVGGLVGKNYGLISDSSFQSVCGSFVTGTIYVGGLAGKNLNSIDGSSASGSVTGTNYVGGLVGYNGPVSARPGVVGTITNSSSSASVQVNGGYGGGLVGYSTVGSSIAGSSATGFVYTSNGAANLGGLVGYNRGGVSGSYATGGVSGSSNVGGLAGYNDGSISGSYATGAVSGSNNVGGLVGENAGAISAAYATGAVSSASGKSGYSGGLVGYNDAAGTISGSYATGNVDGSEYVGGLVGGNAGALSNVYATGSVSAAGKAGFSEGGVTGGLVGYNASGATISDAYATGTVSAAGGKSGFASYAGGLVGENDGGILRSYASGNVTADTGSGSFAAAGGLVGYNNGSVADAYASGTVNGSGSGVSGTVLAGGLLGYNNGGVSNVYAIGATTAAASGGTGSFSYSGGLVGRNDTGGTIDAGYATGAVTNTGNGTVGTGGVAGDNAGSVSNVYWDPQTTGQAGAVGTGSSTGTAPVGLSNPSRYAASSYAGFDFTPGTGHWVIIEGLTRPFLSFEYSTTIVNAHQLQLMTLDPTASYTLGRNIDMSELNNLSGLWRTSAKPNSQGDYGFVPVGTVDTPFSGTLNGNGYTISGLTIHFANSDYVGLVGYSDNSSIDNLTISGGTITGHNVVGALLGMGSGSITRVHSSAAVNGNSVVGGLVGWSTGGFASIIAGSDSSGDVTATDGGAGGLVGFNDAFLYEVFATGSVSSSGSAGGLVELNTGFIFNAYATGAVSGDEPGGLVAQNGSAGAIVAAYSTGTVTGLDGGGLIGRNEGQLASTYWDVDTSGTSTGVQFQSGSGSPTPLGTGYDDPRQQASYSGFDFSASWNIDSGINDGRPYLRNDPPVSLVP